MALAALRSEGTVGKKLTLAGPQDFTVAEVIAVCERLAGSEADVTQARHLACALNYLRIHPACRPCASWWRLSCRVY